jgi:hypothetical protein
MSDAEQWDVFSERILVIRNFLKEISNARNHCFSNLNFDVAGRHSYMATQ